MPAPSPVEEPKRREAPVAPPEEKPSPREPVPPSKPARHPLLPTKRPDVMPRPKANLNKVKSQIINFFTNRSTKSEQTSFSSFYKTYQFIFESTEQWLDKMVREGKIRNTDKDNILKADPTNNKNFVKWIVNELVNNRITLNNDEDVNRVRETLSGFFRLKASPKFFELVKQKYPEINQPANILQYTFNQLLDSTTEILARKTDSTASNTAEKNILRLKNIVKEQKKLNEEDIKYIIDADPTINKNYVLWIYREAAGKSIKIEKGEDVESVSKNLKEFILIINDPAKYKILLKIIKEKYPNIETPNDLKLYSYNTLGRVLIDFENKTSQPKSKKRGERELPLFPNPPPGLTLMNQNNNGILWKMNGEIASKLLQPSKYCQGNWCVKDPEFQQSYGDTYYVIQQNGELKYLFDPKGWDFKNAKDSDVNIDELEQLWDLILPVIEKFPNPYKKS